jgi:UDP-3-O-[3-hydroxymyristoyl] glucosamine N-acyltransferase
MSEKPKVDQPLFKLRELARLLDCPLEGDGETEITGVAGLENAGPGDLVFLSEAKRRPALEACRASAAIIPAGESFARMPVLKSANPHLTFIRATELFFSPYRPAPGIHPTAAVSASARVGKNAAVGALSVVGDDVDIGEGAVIFPLVSIYPRVRIGAGTVIHSQVSIREDVRLGERVIIHNGVVIGADGFGYVRNPDGTHRKIPHKGTVVIEDDVEVGANSTIDRAALGETVIRRGTKIDNLVMIAHNVEIGSDTLLAGQTGIAGSSKVGNSVIMAGQVGVADHLQVGDKAIIAAKTGVGTSVPAGSFVAGGVPHLDIREWRKLWAGAPRLYDLIKDFKRLKARVEELEKELGNTATVKKP